MKTAPSPDLEPPQVSGRVQPPESLPEVFASIRVPASGASRWRKMLAFVGPGLLVAVGYMDPGNWATDLAGGSQFGYLLLSVVLVSSLMAMLLQHLALKLGVATGYDLAQACRARFSTPVSIFLWLTCELAIVACDLAEVIGSAIALNLLFGLPLIVGVILTVADVLAILLLQQRGFRYLEALVGGLIFLIAACFAYEMVVSRPDWLGVLGGMLPQPKVVMDRQALYLALGILGATVMPHNLYLHSSIVQTRAFDRDETGRAQAIRYATVDSTVCLFFAFFINAAILILSAATFHVRGMHHVAEIQDAYHLLTPTLGASLASILFAVALLASGQNSTLTGTLAGQIVMEGFVRWRLRPWLRRLVTRGLAIIPAGVAAAFGGESATGKLLIFSQVVLALQLPFAVVPLVMFTGDRKLMGRFANGPWIQVTAWAVALLIAVLGVYGVWLVITSDAYSRLQNR